MSGPKPTLGYPSRTAAVLALRDQGLPLGAIAARIGIPVTTVSALECSARRSPADRRSPDACRTVHVSTGTLQLLAPEARRRGISREHLAALIIDTVAEAGLVDAVLDDHDEEARR